MQKLITTRHQKLSNEKEITPEPRPGPTGKSLSPPHIQICIRARLSAHAVASSSSIQSRTSAYCSRLNEATSGEVACGGRSHTFHESAEFLHRAFDASSHGTSPTTVSSTACAWGVCANRYEAALLHFDRLFVFTDMLLLFYSKRAFRPERCACFWTACFFKYFDL